MRVAKIAAVVGAAVAAGLILWAIANEICRRLEWTFTDLAIFLALYLSIFIAVGLIGAFLIENWNLHSKHKYFVRGLFKLRKRFPDRVQIGLLALAAAVALHALTYYRQQTTFNILMALQARDSATRWTA